MIEPKAPLPVVPFAGIMISALVLPVVLAATLEWEHYRQAVSWKGLDLSVWDRGFLFWLLCAKTLWLLGPLLAGTALLRRARWHRTAALLFTGGASMLVTLLVADVLCQRASGNHLGWLLAFVGTHRAWEWAGDATLVDRRAFLMLGGTLTGTLALQWAWQWQARRATRRWPALASSGWRLAVGGTVVVAAVGALAGQFLADPVGLQWLERALPVRLGWYHTDLSGFQSAFEAKAQEAYRPLQPRIAHGQPVDDAARVEGADAPNVIVVVLESFRHDALCPRTMPVLSRWAEKSLRFQRHYAGSNCSHLGIFSLLYARNPFVYDVTLAAGTPPQAPRTFHNSGYETSFITSGGVNWMGMEKFINDKQFDRVVLEENDAWPDRDRLILRGHIPKLLREAGRPQFIVAFLMSTHFHYEYPPEYEKFRPVATSWSWTDPNLRRQQQEVYNRYCNSLYFLDAEVGNFLEKLDLKRNIVVVTGDHGESFWDDDTFAHWRKGSDAQTQVPLVMAGPGVRPGAVADLTRHADLLPSLLHLVAGRHVPVQWTHGDDVFADGYHNDHVVLHPLGTMPGLLLVGRQQRLRVDVRLDNPQIRVDGFFDAADRYDATFVPADGDDEVWRAILNKELERCAY